LSCLALPMHCIKRIGEIETRYLDKLNPSSLVFATAG